VVRSHLKHIAARTRCRFAHAAEACQSESRRFGVSNHIPKLQKLAGPGSPRLGRFDSFAASSLEVGERENGRVVDAAEELELAVALAVRAHHGQRYPSPEAEPYIVHSVRVMLGVSGVRVQAVGVLHDVLEDTAVTVEELRESGLSSEVVNAVIALTRRSGQTYERYIEQVASNDIARQVKLADLADNLANNRRVRTRPDVVARIERYERAIRRLQAPDVASR
jgi:(p)ppGpp synthase/HD superfamily hydrolase